jgi:hypothetical protein
MEARIRVLSLQQLDVTNGIHGNGHERSGVALGTVLAVAVNAGSRATAQSVFHGSTGTGSSLGISGVVNILGELSIVAAESLGNVLNLGSPSYTEIVPLP